MVVRRELAPWLWGLVLVLFGLSSWGVWVHLFGDATNLSPFYAFVVGVLIQHYGPRLRLPRRSTPLPRSPRCVVPVCGTRKQTAPILLLECLSRHGWS